MTELLPTPKRKYSGTAKWHLSSKAVQIGVFEIGDWGQEQCVEFLANVRWGGMAYIPCPHCGTISNHYYRVLELRWKCQGCGKTFSVLSGTVYSGAKLELRELIGSIFMWLNGASGQPALQLRRNQFISYQTSFVIQHKMREALMRGFNVGILTGDLEMDGSHQSGKEAAKKRGKPNNYSEERTEKEQTEWEQAKIEGRDKSKTTKGGMFDPLFGAELPKDRRMLINIRSRSGKKGQGAFATRVMVAKVEDSTNVTAIIDKFIAKPESYLNTDASGAYTKVGRKFKEHRVVNHTETLVGPEGQNNNQAEEFAWRQDRAEKGVYLNIEPKYLFDYAVENAFRSDTRRLSNKDQLMLGLKIATAVGESVYWKGFTHGKHRTTEILATGTEPAPSSGKPKAQPGAPKLPVGGRKPR